MKEMMKWTGDTYGMSSPYATVIDFVTVNGSPDNRSWIELNLADGWGEHIDEDRGYDRENGGWHTIRVEGEFAVFIAKDKVLEEDRHMFEDVPPFRPPTEDV